MTTILIDHNLTGDAKLLWALLVKTGWAELLQLQMVTLKDVGLPVDSADRAIWRFVQQEQMLLLTDNRNRKGADSLEQTIEDEGTADSLPVITVGSRDRLIDPDYRERCVTRLAEIIVDLPYYLGAARVFIP
jgi:hypothetical protein